MLPNDGVDNSCLETKKGLGDSLVLFDNAEDNFNPTVYSGPERTKRVVITVKLGKWHTCVFDRCNIRDSGIHHSFCS